MSPFDWLYAGLIAAFLVLDHVVLMPRFRRESAVHPLRARQRHWLKFLFLMWTITACGVMLWIHEGRAWNEIALQVPDGWRGWGAIAVVLVFVCLEAWSVSKVARNRDWQEKMRGQVGRLKDVSALVPQTGSELPMWFAASITAGVCEEFLCRGFLIWFFHHWMGWWPAAAVSLGIFAIGHAYQGARGVVNAALAGAFLTGLVAIFDSLLPAMAVHALVDLGSGCMSFFAIRAGMQEPKSTLHSVAGSS